jgi:hypothetical protein
MEMNNEQMIKIPLSEYKRLKECSMVDRELLLDISKGIKDILSGEIEEI